MTGENVEKHLEHLCEVLSQIQKAGMHLKRAKCSFMMPEVSYFGHVIFQTGIRPAAEKVRAVFDAPVPTNVSQLKSFLGLINFYSCCLSTLSTLLTHYCRRTHLGSADHHNRKLSTLLRTLFYPH